MVWIAIGTGTLLLLLWLLRVFASAPAETVRKVGTWALGGLGVGLILLAVITGRGAQAIWMGLFLAPLIWRFAQHWRGARRFAAGLGRGQAGGAGEETAVQTATLLMRLDHATGRMSGRVRAGRHAGRELAELGLPALLELMRECRANDPESVPLLEAWLDRAAPEWREAEAFAESGPAGGGGGGARPRGGAMTREEALAVLGLSEGAKPEEIRAAHRRLMRAAHPDHGGSDWLAARLNEARDVLLG